MGFQLTGDEQFKHIKVKQYDQGVDYKFLEAMDIKVIKHQPWQLGLLHPDLKGKFVWYPQKGTLMYQDDEMNGGGTYGVKIGETGDFTAGGYPEWINEDSTENVVKEIMKKVNEQQNGVT